MLQYCAVGFRPGADDDRQIAFRQQCLLDAEGDVGKERIAQPPEQDSNTAGFSVERSLSDQIGAESIFFCQRTDLFRRLRAYFGIMGKDS